MYAAIYFFPISTSPFVHVNCMDDKEVVCILPTSCYMQENIAVKIKLISIVIGAAVTSCTLHPLVTIPRPFSAIKVPTCFDRW